MKITRKECGRLGVRLLLVEAYLSQGVSPAQIAELIGLAEPHVRDIAKQYYRLRMECVWEMVSKPLKFPSPARRRREDREIPKAA